MESKKLILSAILVLVSVGFIIFNFGIVKNIKIKEVPKQFNIQDCMERNNTPANNIQNKVIIKIREKEAIKNEYPDISKDKYRYKECILNIAAVQSKGRQVVTKKQFKNKAKMERIIKERGLASQYVMDGSYEDMVNKYAGKEYVEFVQPVFIYENDLKPNDPLFNSQLNHARIQTPLAWDITTGSENVIIAVIDNGFRRHEDLLANIWTNNDEIPSNNIDDDNNGYIDDVNGWNFRNSNNNVFNSELHGTWVAGLAAAVGNNNKGICGMSWHSKIMPIVHDGTSMSISNAILYAVDNGADIINMSFGTDNRVYYESLERPAQDYTVKEALDIASREGRNGKGIISAASAGNNSIDVNHYPAAFSNVIAVGGTNVYDEMYLGSDFGRWVDVCAQAVGTLTTYNESWYRNPDTPGTSFSSPQVAGLAALILSNNPDLTNTEVRAIIENTTDRVNVPFYLGTGRINAYRAVENSNDCIYPLGEIIEPINKCIFREGDEIGKIKLTAYGDYYKVEYSNDFDTWNLIEEGNINGLYEDHEIDWNMPAELGVYIIKLTTEKDGNRHEDTKIIYVEGGYKESWPVKYLADNNIPRKITACPICMDIDDDGRNEIIQSSYGNYGVGGYTYIWDEDGADIAGWPNIVGGDPSCSTSAVGDVDGDGDWEIITTTYAGAYVYVWHWENGEILHGWPKKLSIEDSFGNQVISLGRIRANPVLADFDKDGDSEIIVGVMSNILPVRNGSKTDYIEKNGWIYVFHHDGTVLNGWPQEINGLQAPMAAADLDNDGDIELVATTINKTYVFNHDGTFYTGWPVNGGSLKGVIIADIDKDDRLEIIYASTDTSRSPYRNKLCAEHVDHSSLNGWPIDLSENSGVHRYGALSVGDLDLDGYPEIFMAGGDDGSVYAFDRRGMQLNGFPKFTEGGVLQSSPTIGDINNDGYNEVLVGSGSGLVFAWDAEGNMLRNFPRPIGGTLDNAIYTTPTLADIDKDGFIDIMLGTLNGRFYIWDTPGIYDPDKIEWGMYRHDAQCSGLNLKTPKITANIVNLGDIYTVRAERKFELPLTIYNPNNLPVKVDIRGKEDKKPYGAVVAKEEDGYIFIWTPSSAQARDEVYEFYCFVSDGIRQDHLPVKVLVVRNNPPVANNMSLSVNEDALLQIPLDASDPDGDPLMYQVVSGPVHGTLSGIGSSRVYTPTLNYNGPDSFSFKVNDGVDNSNIGTILIDVAPVNDAPILNLIGNKTIDEGQELSFTVSSLDPDTNDLLSYSVNNLPRGATFAGQIFKWTPESGQAGTYNVSFSASDGQLNDSETISIIVNRINDVFHFIKTPRENDILHGKVDITVSIDGLTLPKKGVWECILFINGRAKYNFRNYVSIKTRTYKWDTRYESTENAVVSAKLTIYDQSAYPIRQAKYEDSVNVKLKPELKIASVTQRKIGSNRLVDIKVSTGDFPNPNTCECYAGNDKVINRDWNAISSEFTYHWYPKISQKGAFIITSKIYNQITGKWYNAGPIKIIVE